MAKLSDLKTLDSLKNSVTKNIDNIESNSTAIKEISLNTIKTCGVGFLGFLNSISGGTHMRTDDFAYTPANGDWVSFDVSLNSGRNYLIVFGKGDSGVEFGGYEDP